jgi:ketosteroid isomerase-like protein
MMDSNQAAVEGKQAIQAVYEARVKENAGKMTLTAVFTLLETQVAGDWAYDRGNYTLTVTPKSGKPTETSGKYLTIYKRQPDGSWKIYRDISNSNNPPPSAVGKKK